MSTTVPATVVTAKRQANPQQRHRVRVGIAATFAFCAVIVFLVNGFAYYRLPLAMRPFSPRHEILKPSGPVGLSLGVLGFCMFCGIFLYPLRKKWAWLGRIGTARHWLDFHIVLGLAAPWVIACHSSFKFRGFAGIAFWTMTMVAASGVIGRYLYAQIPRRVNSAELTLLESRELQEHMVDELAKQEYFQPADFGALFRLPSEAQVESLPLVGVLFVMMRLDLVRPFHIARLRRRALSGFEKFQSLGGLLRSKHADIEAIIDLAGRQAAISKRVAFLYRAHRIFKLWHVVHRPFSFTFIVLALIHISVVLLLGFAQFG